MPTALAYSGNRQKPRGPNHEDGGLHRDIVNLVAVTRIHKFLARYVQWGTDSVIFVFRRDHCALSAS